MILTVTGYTTGEIKVEDGDYGKNATICVRAKSIGGKQSHFVNATFYGKVIDTLLKYCNEDGRQVTLTGGVKKMVEKEKKDGNKYVAVYMQGYNFSIPENRGPGEERYASGNRKRNDDEVAF